MVVVMPALRLGVLVVALATFCGLFAPLVPTADMINHVRPWLLLACILLVLLGMLEGSSRWRTRVAALTTVNFALFLLPWVMSPASSNSSSEMTEVRVLSLNVLIRNKTPDRVAAYLLEESADIVLLQEIAGENRTKILSRLADDYPYVHRCNCHNQILLSKKPWLEAGGQPLGRDKPPMIWARFEGVAGVKYWVMGLHPVYPLKPMRHENHYRWLIGSFAKPEEPLILAGDFNATPWSWKLTSFAWLNGLKRGYTFAFNWPSHWPIQLFMIDNIFVSRSLSFRSVRIGPDVGSDHRPIVGRIAVPTG